MEQENRNNSVWELVSVIHYDYDKLTYWYELICVECEVVRKEISANAEFTLDVVRKYPDDILKECICPPIDTTLYLNDIGITWFLSKKEIKKEYKQK